jgi:hypothetical protein
MMPLTLMVTEADIAEHAAMQLGNVAALDAREMALLARELALDAKERDLAARMQAMADVVMRSGYGVPNRPSLESFSPLMAKE